MLTSKSYTLQKKRNNFNVCFNNSKNAKRIGEINTFCTVERKIWVIIDTMDTSSNAFINSETTANTSHIHKVLSENVSMKVIPIEDINDLCLRVLGYICTIPNSWEINL